MYEIRKGMIGKALQWSYRSQRSGFSTERRYGWQRDTLSRPGIDVEAC